MEQSTALSKVESTAIAVEYEVLGTKVALDIEFVKKYLVRGRAENVTKEVFARQDADDDGGNPFD